MDLRDALDNFQDDPAEDQGQFPNDLDLNDVENQIDDQEQQDNDDDSNSDNRFPETNDGGWIQWFCQLDDNEFFVEVDESFIQEKANLIGINCKEYLERILSPDAPTDENLNDDSSDALQGIKEAYGLIHRRFITTPKGLALVREKYLNGDYGQCPRVLCHKQVLLPVGLSNDTKYSRVKVYCPMCEEVYKPKRQRKRPVEIDGAYFGTSFPQIFLMTYPDLNPKNKNFKEYIPKLYGFKIFGKKGSKYYSSNKQELIRTKKKLDISLNADEYDEDEYEV